MNALSELLQSFADLFRPVVDFLIWIFPFKIYRLHNGQRGVITTFGKAYSWRNPEKGPGTWFVFMFEEMTVVQAKGGFIDLNEQNLMTKDKKVIIFNGAIIYSIKSVKLSILETEDIEYLLSGLLMNKIREHARNKNLDEIVDSEKLTRELSTSLTSKAKKLGVKVEEIMITDLRPHPVIYACDSVEKMFDAFMEKTIKG